MDNKQVRKLNLAWLSQRHGGPTAFAEMVGRSQVQVSQWIGGTPVGDKLARHIETALGYPRGWLDAPQWTYATAPETNSDAEHVPPSQPAGLDRATLHEALTLLFYDESHAGDYTPQARTDRLAELYRWVAADGGRLSKERNAAFVQQVSERHQEAGVTSGATDSPGRTRGRRTA